jgi:hypothetical protein
LPGKPGTVLWSHGHEFNPHTSAGMRIAYHGPRAHLAAGNVKHYLDTGADCDGLCGFDKQAT